MPRLKRTRDEAGLDFQEQEHAPQQNETLTKLRNMWEFASLMQYIYLFGSIVKIDDDYDIEDLEADCISTSSSSQRLAQTGLQFLKYVSSHRGLNLENYDEYARRQYVAKAPFRNPFGEEEEPARFNDFDVYTKIRVLHQLSLWTLYNADRFRASAPQEDDQTLWRMEPLGWDKEDRAYFVLDDNRLYRRSDEPVPPPSPPKAKSKVKKKKTPAKKKSSRHSRGQPTRSSKRLKTELNDDDDEEMGEEDPAGAPEDAEGDETLLEAATKDDDEGEVGYGFTSKTWECIAVTLEEYQTFLAEIHRTKDLNEKQLRKRIEEDVLPIIEKRAEQIRQKELKKIRELENLQRMATAKRSSRLAGKADREKEEREKREAQERHERELKMAREEENRLRRIEEGHESRRQTREQRVKEREAKRILHQEALDRLQEQEERADSQGLETDDIEVKRISHRQTKAQREQLEKELADFAEEDDKWYFDCSKCGMHGENLDDGSHSIACDKCNVWQHSKCHNIAPEQAEKDGFTFVCQSCKRKEEEAARPKPTIKIARSSEPGGGDSSIKSEDGHPNGATGQLAGVYIPKIHPGGHSATAQLDAQATTHAAPIAPATTPSFSAGLDSATRSLPKSLHELSGPGHVSSPPRQHKQQHFAAHQNAVVAAGGHPAYSPMHKQPIQENGVRTNGHATIPPTSPSARQLQEPPHNPNQLIIHQYQPKRPGSSHTSHHGSSPVKPTTQPMATPPRPLPRPPSHHSNAPPPNFHLPHSPKTTFPPPSSSFSQNGHSPVKSSPPSSQETQPHSHNPSDGFNQTPQSLRPHPADPRNFETPRAVTHRNGNGIVADGMSGPWPEGSKVIPQKHDQSPAPPSSSQAINEKRILPPVAALAPSPNHHHQTRTGAESIPVKKLLEEGPPQLSKELQNHSPVLKSSVQVNRGDVVSLGETTPTPANPNPN